MTSIGPLPRIIRCSTAAVRIIVGIRRTVSAYGTVTRSAPAGRRPPKPSHQTKSFMTVFFRCPAMPTAQTNGQCWVRPAGMSDGHPDRPIVHPSVQSLLGAQRWLWTVVLGHSSRHPQPSCPAMPTAQTDGQSPGPAGRHVRRPSRPPDRASCVGTSEVDRMVA